MTKTRKVMTKAHQELLAKALGFPNFKAWQKAMKDCPPARFTRQAIREAERLTRKARRDFRRKATTGKRRGGL